MSTDLIQHELTTPLRIVGRAAIELTNDARWVIAKWGRGWHEVSLTRECGHGCKIYARQRGIRIEYMLHHSSTYGCPLGRSDATVNVPIEVQPKAVA